MANTSEELRIRAMKLVARAESDPKFAARAKADPAAVLREAGIPPEDALLARHGEAQSASVGGTTYCCHDWTCWTSDCPSTCYLTIHTHAAERTAEA
jgi:hypothetical protein